MNWQKHTPNEQAKPSKDFIALNRVATKKGKTTAKEFNEFVTNNYIGKRVGVCKAKEAGATIDKNLVHGITSKSDKRTDMGQIMHNEFLKDWSTQQKDRIAEYEKNKIVKKTRVGETKASRGHAIGATRKQQAALKTESTTSLTSELYMDVPSKISQYIGKGKVSGRTLKDVGKSEE